MSDPERPQVLAIVGVTASGKSALAMQVARADRRVELISVDSMQVYKGMNIGTAKPTKAEQAEIRHHLIDLVPPSVDFSVSEFQAAAFAAIAEVEARGGIPVLVGGTGLHLRAVVDQLDIPGQYPEVVGSLESTPTAELHLQLVGLDADAAARIEPGNRRRIIRALEVTLGSGKPFSSYGPGLDSYGDTRFVMVGPRWSRTAIDERIQERYSNQMQAGFLAEVEHLAHIDGGLSRTAGQALGYRQLLDHLRGEVTLEEALDAAVAATRRFARRQERWFRRDPRIRWIDVESNPMEAEAAVMGEYKACT